VGARVGAAVGVPGREVGKNDGMRIFVGGAVGAVDGF
jgi:hypothetical protein